MKIYVGDRQFPDMRSMPVYITGFTNNQVTAAVIPFSEHERAGAD
jgi:hypothetical protein